MSGEHFQQAARGPKAVHLKMKLTQTKLPESLTDLSEYEAKIQHISAASVPQMYSPGPRGPQSSSFRSYAAPTHLI